MSVQQRAPCEPVDSPLRLVEPAVPQQPSPKSSLYTTSPGLPAGVVRETGPTSRLIMGQFRVASLSLDDQMAEAERHLAAKFEAGRTTPSEERRRIEEKLKHVNESLRAHEKGEVSYADAYLSKLTLLYTHLWIRAAVCCWMEEVDLLGESISPLGKGRLQLVDPKKPLGRERLASVHACAELLREEGAGARIRSKADLQRALENLLKEGSRPDVHSAVAALRNTERSVKESYGLTSRSFEDFRQNVLRLSDHLRNGEAQGLRMAA